MGLQATEATLVKMDKEGSIVTEEDIAVELVQKGDLLKVWIILVHNREYFKAVIKELNDTVVLS